jgi:hypothetical protein
MRQSAVLIFVVLIASTSAGAASNLNLSKSNINRLARLSTPLTATVDVAGEAPTVVYRTPDNADFVLTQVCVGPINGGILLNYAWNTPQNVRPLAFVQGGSCTTFAGVGMPLPPGGNLSCTPAFDFDARTFCTITGLVGQAYPSPTPSPVR